MLTPSFFRWSTPVPVPCDAGMPENKPFMAFGTPDESSQLMSRTWAS